MPNLKGNFKEEYIMEIWNSIVNVALPIIITGAVGLLAKLIYKVGDVLIDSAKAKKEESGLNQQLVQHKDVINTAKQVWNIIEEKYRITEKVEDLIVSKADMFDDLLLQKIPYLTKENLSDLRQAIAGEFNKGKQAVITDDTLKTSQIELTNTNTSLVNTNNDLTNQNQQLVQQVSDLTNKLNTINNAIANANVSNNVTVGGITVNSNDVTNIMNNIVDTTNQTVTQ